MTLKTQFVSLSMLAAVLLPAAAYADHRVTPANVSVGVEINAPPRPAGRPQNPGRYELRTVSRWVPGRWEEQWVPGVCRQKRHKVKCSSGYMERRWVPGYEEKRQDWVWVPAHEHRASGPNIRIAARF
jgi:hypothetical protein